MHSVSDRANHATWTAEVVPCGGRLLDVEAIAVAVRAAGEPFSVRGVEAVIDGELVEVEGRLALKVGGTGEVLVLGP